MSLVPTIRRAVASIVTAFMFAAVCDLAVAQPGASQKGNGPRPGTLHMPGSGHAGQNKEHLPQWMARHSDMPLAEQQKALESEPGFHDLPAETQQRLRDRLTQLNNMPPEQRQRLLERNEAIASMSAAQRQQFRGAMQQFSSLPQDRRRLVGRAFRDLREMPEPQRQALMNSDRFRSQFSDEERNTLNNLLAVEPYIPVQKPKDPQDFGR